MKSKYFLKNYKDLTGRAKKKTFRKMFSQDGIAKELNLKGEKKEFREAVMKASRSGNDGVTKKEMRSILAKFKTDKTNSINAKEARNVRKALGFGKRVSRRDIQTDTKKRNTDFLRNSLGGSSLRGGKSSSSSSPRPPRSRLF